MKYNIYIIGFLVLLVGFGTGILFHKKVLQESIPDPLDLHRIDSLTRLNETLQDSLAYTRAQKDQNTKVIVKYRTQYDTITVALHNQELIQNLRAIANTPIQ